MTPEKKDLLFFDWAVIDDCNLNCSYCVNKGEYSQKERTKISYSPGREIEIARKIAEISQFAKKVIVVFSGGEPLLARNIVEVIEILSAVPNIETRLITNLISIDRIMDHVPKLSQIVASLHIKYRSDADVEFLISRINKLKNITALSLAQVDYGLSIADRKRLCEIESKTGQRIFFQSYIPPWTVTGKISKEKEVEAARNFVTSLGKRCALGYFYYIILADASFYYGLWCNSRYDKPRLKMGNFLDGFSVNKDKFFPPGMEKCPYLYCGCNYNTIYEYGTYRSACKQLGYKDEEIFKPQNISFVGRLRLLRAMLLSKGLGFLRR
ncbi:MAG: radical SAM protein [Candidatus Omnitrophica bacterium]|nr:radical SAM protein [Candidatus Omnitrophota bacterium]MDD5652851.1 radical SAM protein [Candidatus Omnitrophota bacterium]